MKKVGVGIVSGLVGLVTGGAAIGRLSQKILRDKEEKVDKFRLYYSTLNQWLVIKQEKRNLSEYFIERDYRRIAIYGLGEIGNRLIDELKDTEVEIVYGIDKDIDGVFNDLSMYSIEELDGTEQVDVVIVTPIFAFNMISGILEEKLQCPIISIEDVVFEM